MRRRPFSPPFLVQCGKKPERKAGELPSVGDGLTDVTWNRERKREREGRTEKGRKKKPATTTC